MSHLLLACLLLFLAREPAPDAVCESRAAIQSYWTNHAQIFSDTLGLLVQLAEEMEDGQEMLPLAQMGLMMVDWLDPQKAVYVSSLSAPDCEALRV